MKCGASSVHLVRYNSSFYLPSQMPPNMETSPTVGPTRADYIMDVVESFWRRFVDLLAYTNRSFQLEQKLNAAKRYAMEHPVLSIFTVVTIGMCLMPITCFLAFALGSMFLSFMVFMIFEGLREFIF